MERTVCTACNNEKLLDEMAKSNTFRIGDSTLRVNYRKICKTCYNEKERIKRPPKTVRGFAALPLEKQINIIKDLYLRYELNMRTIDVAKKYGINPMTLYNWLNKGDIYIIRNEIEEKGIYKFPKLSIPDFK